MEVTSFMRAMFHGSHSIPGHYMCDRDCGHTWYVVVRAVETDAFDEGKFMQDVHGLAAQLNGKDIDAMIKPGISTPSGIARWFYELLAMSYKVTEVEVWLRDYEHGARLRAP